MVAELPKIGTIPIDRAEIIGTEQQPTPYKQDRSEIVKSSTVTPLPGDYASSMAAVASPGYVAPTAPPGTPVATGVPAPSPSQVYSADNITQASTAPAPTYNMNDPMGIYDSIMNSPEITAAMTEMQKAQAEVDRIKAEGRQVQTMIEGNNEFSLNTLRGSQDLASRRTSDSLSIAADILGQKQSLLAALKDTAQDKFNIANAQRQEINQLIINNPGAGIKYGDTIEEAAGKIETYNKKVEAEQTERLKEEKKKAYKDELKATARSMGINTKGLSTKELEKKIAKKNKSALAQAQERADAEWNMKVQAHNNSMSSGGSDDYKKTEEKLYTDVDSWKQKMRDGDASWADAWGSIQRKYGLSVDVIDALLGVDYRDKYDN